MNLIERAKNITLTPATEWETINQETTTTAQLYTGYIMLLAAIGPIASFIGVGMFSLLFGLVTAVFSYVFSLIGVFILALVIDALATNFGGQKNQIQALKVAAYAQTPFWLASVLHIVPFLGILAMLGGIYSIYVLYLGLPVVMKAAKEQAVAYTAVVVVIAAVIGVLIGAVVGGVAVMLTGFSLWAGAAHYGHNSNIDVDAARQISASIQGASNNLASGNQAVNTQAPANPAAAMNAAAAAMAGNGKIVEAVDQNVLKALLPESVGGMKRNKFEAEKVGMGNFMISKADAGYADDQSHSVDITITDAGSSAMFAGLAAWAMIEQDKETDDGYEKMGKVDGRPVHERFNKKAQDGEYSVVVGGRFVVEAHGRQVDMSTLKQAVAGIDLNKLDAMKTYGEKQ